ncbi:argininosuccinate lyase [Candidatus Bipolaricaulota bacterium]|nr:argininosuccinate lyase [Candidatus Bipolaricaulota bacterium]
MTWHEAYRRHVLDPCYAHSAAHLGGYLLDAMIAHVLAVRNLSLAAAPEAQADIRRLLGALERLRTAPLAHAPPTPDLYTTYVHALEREAGPRAVSYLRLGLSRNDLDMTAYRMHARELVVSLAKDLVRLRTALLAHAARHVCTVFVAQTHHRPAQPTTLAHYLAAVDAMVERDLRRLLQALRRLNECPLGAAALGGTSYGLDRALTARLLGFGRPVANTLDAVAASDWELELSGILSTVAVGLSRLVADLISWAAGDAFVLPPTLCEGSSIMPHKRNPVALEHVRATLARVPAHAQAAVFASHNIPFSDHNDFGPDVQDALTRSFAELRGAAELLAVCLEEGTFDARQLAPEDADAASTELADHLTRCYAVPFGDAHRVVGALADRLRCAGRGLAEASPDDLTAVGGPPVPAEEIRAALNAREFVRRRCELGGPEQGVMEDHIRRATRRLHAWQERVGRTEAALRHYRDSLRYHKEAS